MRWTEKDRRTLASALNDAMDERESFADAYHCEGPEAERAMASVKAYEALYVKFFGQPSGRQQERDRFAAMPSVSIHTLMKREDKSE